MAGGVRGVRVAVPWRVAVTRSTVVVALMAVLMAAVNAVVWPGDRPAGGGAIYVGTLFGVVVPWARMRLRHEVAAFTAAAVVLVVGLAVVEWIGPIRDLSAVAYYATFAVASWLSCMAFAATTHVKP